MSDRKLSYQDLIEVIKLVESSPQFEDFRLKYDGVEIELSKTGRARAASESVTASARVEPAALAPTPVPVSGAAPLAAVSAKGSARQEIPAGMVAVKAPMVGTFYRSPEPGAAPFIQVGASVTKESVVCILEVMKLMNSLTAEVDGVIAEILVADGATVEYGQPLVLIKPKG